MKFGKKIYLSLSAPTIAETIQCNQLGPLEKIISII
jgi:hypothetical protein